MDIRSSVETGETVINIINSNLVVLDRPPPPPPADVNADADSDADAVSKLMQVALGGISFGTFSAGSAGAAYRDQLLAGAHNHAYVVAFFIGLAVVYLASVVEMLAACCVSLNGVTAKKITFVSLLLLLLLVAFGLVTYYLLNNR